jgi:AcrR family transcriptional regulator
MRAGRPARLSRDQVLRAAQKLADDGGLEAVTMVKIGQKVGAEAMSLYRHVRNKEDVLDGIVDLVYSEIELPVRGTDWKSAMRRRAVSVREVLLRHPWAIALMESRSRPGPANLRHHDAVVGVLMDAGFTGASATRAYNLLDSYIYGFALQEKGLPFNSKEELADFGPVFVEQMTRNEYPHLTKVAIDLMKSGFVYADEFEPGLDLILDGLERIRSRARASPARAPRRQRPSRSRR